jgi:hypothetical protein
MIGELRGPGDHRPTRARHPDAIVVDAALQLAAAPVLEVESVESGGEGGGHGLPKTNLRTISAATSTSVEEGGRFRIIGVSFSAAR